MRPSRGASLTRLVPHEAHSSGSASLTRMCPSRGASLTRCLGRHTTLHRVTSRCCLAHCNDSQELRFPRATSSSTTARTTPHARPFEVCCISFPTIFPSFTIRLGEGQGRQESSTLKVTESPQVTFSGSGKEPSVLIPSLGFLPELSEAQIKANKILRPCFVTF